MEPTVPGLRERKKQERNSAIRRTALALFAERGYDETTIADIADAVEIAPRTVSLYYPTKLDIVLGGYSESTDRLLACLRHRSASASTAGIFLTWLREERLSTDESHLALVRQVFDRNPHLHALAMAHTAVMRTQLAQSIAQEIEADPADPLPDIVAAALIGIYQYAWTLPSTGFDQTVGTAMHVIEAGLSAARSSQPQVSNRSCCVHDEKQQRSKE